MPAPRICRRSYWSGAACITELGADVIKTFYTGAGFEKVTAATPVPILALGAKNATRDRCPQPRGDRHRRRSARGGLRTQCRAGQVSGEISGRSEAGREGGDAAREGCQGIRPELSGRIRKGRLQKMNELDAKRSRLLTWLADGKLEAVYLTRVSNFAWLTGGLEPVVMLSSDRAEGRTADHASAILRRVQHDRTPEAPRTRTRWRTRGMPFTLRRGTTGCRSSTSLVRGRRWAADWPLPGGADCSAEIARLRFHLLPEEVDRYRRLGRATGLALERAARQIRPGMSEMEIAGLMAAETMHEGVTPTMLLVGTDERIFRYRHPIPTPRALETYALLAICAWRWGLVASATRLVHFGQLDPELQRKQEACAFVDATFNLSAVIGAAVSDVFHRATMAYADAGFPDEWKKHNQGGSAGYESRDYEGTPTCPEHVLEEQGFAWNPSITGVKSEDTMIVHADGPEFLTTTRDWPTVHVTVGNQHLDRTANSDLLRRAPWRSNPGSACW